MYDCQYHHEVLEELIGLDRTNETFLDRCKLYLTAEPELSRRILNVQFTNAIAAAELPRDQLQFEGALDDLSVARDQFRIPLGVGEIDSASYFAAVRRSLLFEHGVQFPFTNRDFYFLDDAASLEVQFQALRAVLTLQAYYRDHRRYPAELAELVPKYFTAIPLDPYTNKPLRYRLDHEGAVVYSVHKNQIDDGGMYYAPYRSVTHFGSPPSTVIGNPNDLGLRAYIAEAQPLIAPKPKSPAPVLNFP